MEKNIAILGGSFNPVHKGHIMLAKAAYEEYSFDKVYIMPNCITYYKKADNVIPDFHREAMIKLAIRPYDYMEYSDMELKRGGITYTVDTLKEFKEKYPDTAVSFIMGGDSLKNFHTWKDSETLVKLADYLVAARDEVDRKMACSIINEYNRICGRNCFKLLNTPMLDISSKNIRNKIKNGFDVSDMLENSVSEYININNLYKE